ncbi:MAG: hypothetical protein PUJ51_24135 [Clostridiales bacterium]|nr:hypothetical protein [Clostridiales bacterium]
MVILPFAVIILDLFLYTACVTSSGTVANLSSICLIALLTLLLIVISALSIAS